jgi:hypothetical protein
MVVLILVLVSVSQLIKSQDVIRLQYHDSIAGKVIGINKKDVIYQSQAFYDSGIYAINRHKVLEIKYANGNISQVSKSRWNKFYRPAIYSIIGGHEQHGLEEKNMSLTITTIGLGHKGLFQLPVKGFGIVYNIDINYGKYGYFRDTNSVSMGVNSGKLYSGNLSAGVEYRYSFFRGLGFYGVFQVGKKYVDFYKNDAQFYSNDLIYSVSNGIYLNRFQLGLNFSWGQLMRSSVPKTGEIIQTRNIKLSEWQLFIAYAF